MRSQRVVVALITFLLVSVVASNTHPATGDSENMALLGRWAIGPAYANDVVGTVVYWNNGAYLEIHDFANPAAPVRLGRALLPGLIQGIDVHEFYALADYAYVADGADGLRVVDVVNPATAHEVGHLDTPGYAWDVQVVSNIAYVADGSSGLRIIDVTNPAAPVEVGFLDTPGVARGVAVSGAYAYVADGLNGLRVVHVLDPTGPVEHGYVDTAGEAYDVVTDGSLAYVADYFGGFLVVDVTMPDAPTVLGSLSGWVTHVGLGGGFVYTSGDVFLRVVSVANPASPVQIGSYNPPTRYSGGVTFANSHAYVCDWYGGIYAVNVFIPTAPFEAGGVAGSGNTCFSVAATGNYAYATTYSGGLRVLDVSDPSAPVEVGHVDDFSGTEDVALQGTKAYVTGQGTVQFHVVDVSNPAAPFTQGGLTLSYSLYGVAVSGNYAYLNGDGSSGEDLVVVDVSNPSAPFVAATLTLTSPASHHFGEGIAVAGNYAYLADGDLGFHIVDISNPTAPVKVASVTSFTALSVDVEGQYAYVGSNPLMIFDISNPASPVLAGTAWTNSGAEGVQVVGGYVYETGYGQGVQVVDAHNPSSPAWIGSYDTGGTAWGLAFSGGNIFAADHSDGIWILKAELFKDIAAALPDVSAGAQDWGDYDNDGDLDLVLVGDTNAGYTAGVYRNDGGAFTDIGAALTPVGSVASAEWGDYDGDGDLDLLITGRMAAPPWHTARVYRNTGGVFADIGAGLAGVRWGSAVWGDYDNDGDLDIALTGATGVDVGGNPVDPRAAVYRNDGNGVFTNAGSALTAVYMSSVAWGDYDNDGDLDLVLAGDTGAGRITRVYRNDAGAFTDIAAGLPGVAEGSLEWGDYDADGDLDILLTGCMDVAPWHIARIYRNNGNGTFTDINAALPGVRWGDGAWGDYDNDGDLDVLLGGCLDQTPYEITRVYRNMGNAVFTDIEVGLPGVKWSSVSWADTDNDGRLDIMLSGGTNRVTRICRNTAATPNTAPAAPAGLTTALSGDHVTLSWTTASDTQTPASGLSYNVRIGMTPGGNEVMPAMSASGGYRRVVRTGNAQKRTSWTVKLPPEGGQCYWSVQAIDGAFAGSPFAAQQNFSAGARFVNATSGPLAATGNWTGVAWGDYDKDGDLDLYVSNSGANRLYRNNGGGVFADATSGPLGDTGDGAGVAWGDYDNDGDLDLFLANQINGDNRLFRNEGAPSWTFVDATSGLLGDTGNIGNGVAWADYNNDGFLDLYVSNAGTANKLFRNESGGVFADATHGPLGDVGWGEGVAWADYDNDGDLDLYLANYGQANRLFRNDGGMFIDATSGPLGDTGNSTGVAWGDYDNDGDLDLYVSNSGANKLLRNQGGPSWTFVDATGGPLGDTGDGAGVEWADYDNDGDLDLYLVNHGQANKLLRNDGGGAFADATNVLLADTGSGHGMAWGDYDNDGDLDLFLANYHGEAGKLLCNMSAVGNHWLEVNLIGTASNRSGIGARVTVVAGGVTRIREISGGSGFLSQGSLTAEFGLGAAATVTSLQVRWPTGLVQTVSPVPPINTIVTVTEPVGTGVEDKLPTRFALHGNVPNPFNPATRIRYDLPSRSQVSVVVYDVQGRLVRRLVDGVEGPGSFVTEWNGTNANGETIASGVYFCRMEAGAFKQTRKLVLLK